MYIIQQLLLAVCSNPSAPQNTAGPERARAPSAWSSVMTFAGCFGIIPDRIAVLMPTVSGALSIVLLAMT